MAETSYFFDGTTTGDSTLAPYSDDEFANAARIIYGLTGAHATGIDLISNGDFAGGETGWSFDGDIAHAVNSGVEEFYRTPGVETYASIYQSLKSPLYTGTEIIVTLDIGNSGANAKTGFIRVRDSGGFGGAIYEAFNIAAGTPLTTTSFTGTLTEDFPTPLFEVIIESAADSDAALRVDNIEVQFYPLKGRGFVLPLQDNELVATYDSGMYIDTGKAFVYGYGYENDALVAASFDAQGGGLNRIDRVVVRVDETAQTASITVVKGIADAAPIPPSTAEYDMLLYWVWLPDGFAGGQAVGTNNIHDERVFTVPGYLNDIQHTKNMIPNSEYLAYSLADTGTDAPDMWYSNGTTISRSATAITNMLRAEALYCDFADTEYVSMYILEPSQYVSLTENVKLIIKGTLNIVSGTVRMTVVGLEGAAVIGTFLTKDYTRQDQFDFTERFEIDYSDTYDTIGVVFTAQGGAAEFTLGQVLLAYGYEAGAARPVHEVLMFDQSLQDAAWEAAVVNGDYEVDLSADFNGSVLRGTRGVILQGRIRDTGSAAGTPSLLALSRNIGLTTNAQALFVEANKDPNNKDRIDWGIAALDQEASWGFNVTATQATSLTATLRIMGVIT